MNFSMRAFMTLVLFLGINSALSASIKSVTRHHSLVKRKAGPWWFESYQPMSGAFEATLLEPKYILANLIYNYDKMVGTQTTQLIEWKNDVVHWRNELNVEHILATDNIPLSYAYVGMVSDIKQQISAYKAIPVEYHWQRTNAAPTKANVCLDFVISDNSNMQSDKELMLWLEYEGNQKPINYGGKSYRVTNLYGRDWTLYEGPNHSNHEIPVLTLIPDTQFDGVFVGDAKEWIMKLVEMGRFTSSAYISAANMGMEAFWGTSLFEARSRMDFLWAGNNFTSSYRPPGFTPPTAGARVPGF